MSITPPVLTPETPADASAVDALIDRAFGPGRYAKAAERLREGREPVRDISVVARAGGAIIGCARLYSIMIGETPALLLGPFAVDDAYRSQGLGAQLIRHACAAADRAGHTVILLVGDQPYFAPLGFSRTRHVNLPGPADQCRVLALALRGGATDSLRGPVRAAID